MSHVTVADLTVPWVTIVAAPDPRTGRSGLIAALPCDSDIRVDGRRHAGGDGRGPIITPLMDRAGPPALTPADNGAETDEVASFTSKLTPSQACQCTLCPRLGAGTSPVRLGFRVRCQCGA